MLKYLVALLLLVGIATGIPTAYIAQGDTSYLKMDEAGGTCWVFQNSEKVDMAPRYDFPSVFSDNATYCPFSKIDTANLPEGDYTILYTYPVTVNGRVIKDVSWQNGSLVSILRKEPIIEENNKSGIVKQHLLEMIKAGGIDRYSEYLMQVRAPYLTITRQEQVGPNIIRVAGESNFADGTPITIKVDEWDHYATHDVANFTFHTTVSKPLAYAPGKWSVDMWLPLQEMRAGDSGNMWHWTYAYAGNLQTSARFPLYQTWEPAPTPTQYINYFGNGSIKPDVVTVEVTKIIVKEVDKWHTATPTPAITDALGDPINYPYEPGKEIPVALGIVMMISVAVIALFAGYKRK